VFGGLDPSHSHEAGLRSHAERSRRNESRTEV
jgi:hypothetical protein